MNHANVFQDIRDVGEISNPGTKADPEFGNGLAVIAIKTNKLSYQQTEVLSTGFINSMDATMAVCQLLASIKLLMDKHQMSPMADIVFKVRVPEHLQEAARCDTIEISYDQLNALNPSVSDSIVNAILDDEVTPAVACILTGKDLPESFKI